MPNRIDRGFFPSAPPASVSRGGPARFKSAAGDAVKTDVKEASDVTALPNGKFVVVGDKSDSIAIIDADGRSVKVKLDGLKDGKSGLEAVTFSPRRNELFVASEEKNKVLRYKFDPDKGTAKLEKEFEFHLGGSKNKGIEGMAWLSGDVSPTGRPQLLIAKEGDPKTLALVEEDGSGKPKLIDLDGALKDVAKDFSAVAVDPVTGNLFVSSDEASLVAEVKLKGKGGKLHAELVQSLPLRDKHDDPLERVEGIAFDSKGNLHVLLENESKLLKLERK
jgi:uncharacterized protein YjiK